MGSKIPACSIRFESSVKLILCSTRICGTQLHKFPAEERAGVASDAKEVGELGEKKIASCPTTTDVSFQSIRIVPVRSRTMLELTPFGTEGKPPPRSSCKSALTFAPATI